MTTLADRRPASYYRNWRKNAQPHRHQRMISRVIRGLAARLGLTQAQLAKQIGVCLMAVNRWSQPRGLSHPHAMHWRRIRELWWFTKYIKTEEFLRDREFPARFDQ